MPSKLGSQFQKTVSRSLIFKVPSKKALHFPPKAKDSYGSPSRKILTSSAELRGSYDSGRFGFERSASNYLFRSSVKTWDQNDRNMTSLATLRGLSPKTSVFASRENRTPRRAVSNSKSKLRGSQFCVFKVGKVKDWAALTENFGRVVELLKEIVVELRRGEGAEAHLLDFINLSQDHRFEEYFSTLSDPALAASFKRSFVLIRAVVFKVAYLHLRGKLKSTAEDCENSADFSLKIILVFLKLLNDELASLEPSHPSNSFKLLVNEVIAPQNQNFFRKKLELVNYTLAVDLYREKLVKSFSSLIESGSASISQGCQNLIEKLDSISLAEANSLLNETFRNFLLTEEEATRDSNVQVPLLCPTPSKPFTLVLDLDETLVHCDKQTLEVLIRPFCRDFLKRMSASFELVVFTSATQSYADWVLDRLDRDSLLSTRLYRQHLSPCDPVGVKNLAKLGRDLSKTIIVDNSPQSFALQKENGVLIPSWLGAKKDSVLRILSEIFEMIVEEKMSDVRPFLKRLSDKIAEDGESFWKQ